MHHDTNACTDACLACARDCLATATTYCLAKGGDHAEPVHMRLMLDCAEICRTAADFMIRGSEQHHLVCAVCAEVCTECALSCDRLHDDRMHHCAEVCRHCAELCRSMSHASIT